MITFKGIRQGLLVILDDGALWEDICASLQSKIINSSGFFKGGTIACDVGHRPLSVGQLVGLRAMLAEHDIVLWAIQSESELTRARAAELGLKTELAPVTSAELPEVIDASQSIQTGYIDGTDGLLVRRRVRSGQMIRHPGHIVVLDDVNPGAQLVAGGDIIVWGKLQGTAHAGALGDEQATICALELSPAILRIADVARRFQAGKRAKHARPERAHIEREEMVVTEWNP